jgi:hypothetical protein
MAKINISYSIDDFMKYKDCNMMLPLNLKPLCNNIGGTFILRDIILKEVGIVIDTFTDGKNPNDIIFKNCVIENLNKINPRNYKTILDALKNLSFSKYEHFATFSHDILLRAMTDSISVKGVEMPEGQLSLSELYADIIVEFSQLMIKEVSGGDKEVEIKFINIFMDQCQKYFTDFVDPTKVLDTNNQYRVDNFKGFMNFLGILFEKHVVSHKIIMSCITKLKDLMHNPQWNGWVPIICENVYEGYRRILNHVYSFYNKRDLSESDKAFIKSVLEAHNSIKVQNDKVNKLRKFTMMAHKDLETKLAKMV